jgi:hypothetical protein
VEKLFVKRLAALISAVLVLFSCEEEEKKLETVTFPELRSVEVNREDEIVLPSEGSEEISFRVTETDFTFSMTGDVFLFLSSGKVTTDYSLKDVKPGTPEGTYSATIKDNGFHKEYNDEVRIGVRSVKGKDVFIFSKPFRVRSKPVGPHDYIPDTGLPVLYLDTENKKSITSKTDYVKASVTVWEEKTGFGEPVDCSVRGRGNTTWEWPKKPYLIKLDSKESFFGMKKHKRWVLLANFMDRTMMRNMIAMKVSSMTSLDWTPSCTPVELVLNGAHRGNYLLIEQVRVDKDRVPATNGYMLECDFHYDNEVQWIDPHGHCVQMGDGIPFGVKYPDVEDLTPDQLTFIKEYIYKTASIIYGPNFADPDYGYASRIDVDSFIDYWIVFEVMGNHELGNPGSVYLHMDEGEKLKAGPCWDFDWGILSYNTSPQAQYGLINGKAIWYARLFEDPEFKAKVKARFEELLPQLETIPAYIDGLKKTLSESAKLNFKMWDPSQDASMNGGNIINGDERMTYDSAVDKIKSIYTERLQVIHKNL